MVENSEKLLIVVVIGWKWMKMVENCSKQLLDKNSWKRIKRVKTVEIIENG